MDLNPSIYVFSNKLIKYFCSEKDVSWTDHLYPKKIAKETKILHMNMRTQ